MRMKPPMKAVVIILAAAAPVGLALWLLRRRSRLPQKHGRAETFLVLAATAIQAAPSSTATDNPPCDADVQPSGDPETVILDGGNSISGVAGAAGDFQDLEIAEPVD